MVNNDKFIFFRLQKCASRSLAEYFNNEFESYNKNNPIKGNHTSVQDCITPKYFRDDNDFKIQLERAKSIIRDRLCVSSIRNPWDWYVSWHNSIKTESRFSSIFNENFNIFIDSVMDLDSGDYPALSFKICKELDIGPLSFRFLRLLSYYPLTDLDKLRQVVNKSEEFKTLSTPIDYFIRFENIKDDIINLYKLIEHPNKGNINLNNFNKTIRGPYEEYYTPETKDLVRHKERMLIKHFNYKF